MVDFPLTGEALQQARARIRELYGLALDVTDEVSIDNKDALELLDGILELAVARREPRPGTRGRLK